MSKILKLCGGRRTRITIPRHVDHRKLLSPVQNQGVMPTCWSFGPLASVEGAYRIITGRVVKFSEQEVIDFYWARACRAVKRHIRKFGYNPELTFHYLMKQRSISLASSYPYIFKFRRQPLSLKNKERVDPLIRGFIFVPNDEFAIRLALATQPVMAVITVDASYDDHCDGSVYTCNGDRDTDEDFGFHAVCITGYGYSQKFKKHIWMVRDQAGPTWNQTGYIMIERNMLYGESVCDISECCMIPLMDGLKPPKLANALKAGLYSPTFYEALENREPPPWSCFNQPESFHSESDSYFTDYEVVDSDTDYDSDSNFTSGLKASISLEKAAQIWVARPCVVGQVKSQRFPCYWPRVTEQELQQISGDLNVTIVPYFEKVLSASDAGRMVLPKACAVDYKAKLSDFGLAKAGPRGDETLVSTRVMGTYGYADPEYVMTGAGGCRSRYMNCAPASAAAWWVR